MQIEKGVELDTFEDYILEVSYLTLKCGGVTSNIDTFQFLPPIDAWALPKYPARTMILPPDADISAALIDFIQCNDSYLHEPDAWLGTWLHPVTHYCYLDITLICPVLEEAIKEAYERGRRECRKIEALYNFKYKQTIYLGEGDY